MSLENMTNNDKANTIIELLSKNSKGIISLYSDNSKLFNVINYNNIGIFYYDEDEINNIDDIPQYIQKFNNNIFYSYNIVCITYHISLGSEQIIIYGNINDIP